MSKTLIPLQHSQWKVALFLRWCKLLRRGGSPGEIVKKQKRCIKIQKRCIKIKFRGSAPHKGWGISGFPTISQSEYIKINKPSHFISVWTPTQTLLRMYSMEYSNTHVRLAAGKVWSYNRCSERTCWWFYYSWLLSLRRQLMLMYFLWHPYIIYKESPGCNEH